MLYSVPFSKYSRGSQSVCLNKVVGKMATVKDHSHVPEFLRNPLRILGIDFAPLLIPVERRLQTLGIIVSLSIWLVIPPCFPILMLYLLTTNYNWITILYVAFIIYEHDVSYKGGRTNMWFRKNVIHKFIAQYFPVRLVKTCDLDASKNYLMCYHPHGIFCCGTVAISTDAEKWEEKFPGLKRRMITLPVTFNIPGMREWALATGACNSSKESIKYCLTTPGFGVTTLVVGGAQESLQGDETTIELALRNRKGFVKVAMESGADLIPCMAFGEQQVYNLVKGSSRLRKFQEWLKKVTTVAPVIFFGRGIFNYSFGLMPFRRPINVVVGSPIPVEKVAHPTREQVEEKHAQYMQALKDLYEEYNPQYGYEGVKLVM